MTSKRAAANEADIERLDERAGESSDAVVTDHRVRAITREIGVDGTRQKKRQDDRTTERQQEEQKKGAKKTRGRATEEEGNGEKVEEEGCTREAVPEDLSECAQQGAENEQ